MNQFQILKELLPYLEQYSREHQENDLMDFSNFLRRQLLTKPVSEQSIPDFTLSENHRPEVFPEVEFSTLLTDLYRFGKHYVKKALLDTDIKTLEEFGCLASLIKTPGLLKSELIQLQLMEISSGTEVANRLIKMGLIKEVRDERDKRAKRLYLTEKGQITIIGAFNEMYKASRIICGNLSDEELLNTTQVMEKLSAFHWHIHRCDKSSGMEVLLEKYINN
jgi:DNA-binding MarR family transcriptional regulator